MMNKLERKRYEMLVRVKDFAASRPDQFLPETPASCGRCPFSPTA